MTGPTVYGFTMIAGKLSWAGGDVSAASRKETLESISPDKGFESVKKLLKNNHKNMWRGSLQSLH